MIKQLICLLTLSLALTTTAFAEDDPFSEVDFGSDAEGSAQPEEDPDADLFLEDSEVKPAEGDPFEITPPPPGETPVVVEESPPKSNKAREEKFAKAKQKSKKSGSFKKLKKVCNMRAKANSTSKVLAKAEKGQKVWAEKHNSEWVKVYRKKGHAFISTTCF